MPDPINATALARLLEPLLTLARHQGLNSETLLAPLELDDTSLQKPGARFLARHYEALLEQLAEAAQNPLIALRLGEATQPRMLGSVGFLMATAATLQEAYQALTDYLPLLYEGAVLQLEQTLEGSWLTLELNDAARKPTEYFLACLVNWPRSLTGHQVPAIRLELSFPAPQDPQAWERFFAAEVVFDAPHNRVLLASNYMSLPCLDANDEMHQLHREFADSLLSHSVQRSALIAQTRNLIRRQLAEGDGLVRREQVADAVNLSLRTLQRKLGQLGTSFQDVYDQTRREHCLQLIQRGQYSFGEIAFRLGFSNQSAFQKAFKRWMGIAPSQYRAQLKPATLQTEAIAKAAPRQQQRWFENDDTIDTETAQRLQQLSDFSNTLLQWAALCGPRFDLNLLASASNNPLARLAIYIWPAQQQELISPLTEPGSDQNPVRYRFNHPHIAQHLLAGQSSRLQQQRHLRLARALLSDAHSTAAQKLQHLNPLRRLPPELAQQRIELNRIAAQHCIQQGDYLTAAGYWQQLLHWQPPAEQADSQLALAHCLLHAQQPTQCQQQLDQLQQQPLSASQQASQAQLQAELWQQQQQPERALPLLCQALALLDKPLASDAATALQQLLTQLQQIEQHLDAGALHQLAARTNRDIAPVLQLCEQLSLLAQQQAQPLLAACAITRMVELALQHGHCQHTPFAFTSYAWVASWFCADEALARYFSAEGLMLAERYQRNSEAPVAATAWLINGSRVSHWFNPLADSRVQLQQAQALCTDNRLLQQDIVLVDANLSWLTGTPLQQLAADNTAAPTEIADSAHWLARQLQHNPPLQLPGTLHGWPAVARITAALLLDQQPLWPTLCQLESQLENQLAGSYGIVEVLFCTGMMRLISAQQQGRMTRRQAQQVAQLESRLDHWARFAPDNFNTPLALIRAEQARLSGQAPATAFEQAITFSAQHNSLHHRGLCYERYADYLAHNGQPRLARFCLAEAEAIYQHWGADAKVKLLASNAARLAQ